MYKPPPFFSDDGLESLIKPIGKKGFPHDYRTCVYLTAVGGRLVSRRYHAGAFHSKI